MVREGALDNNQHENKWCCETETSAEVYRCKIHIASDNTSHNFAWYGMVNFPSLINLEHLDVTPTQ